MGDGPQFHLHSSGKFAELLGRLLSRTFPNKYGNLYGDDKFLSNQNDIDSNDSLTQTTDSLANDRSILIHFSQDNHSSIDIADKEGIHIRAASRIVAKAIREQENIESVYNKSINLLDEGDVLNDKDIDDDWFNKFNNDVADISDDEFQKIWANILANEIKKPGSCSKRTLSYLKDLSKEDALKLEEIRNFTINIAGVVFIFIDLMNGYSDRISRWDISILRDHNLIYEKDESMTIYKGKGYSFQIGDYVFYVHPDYMLDDRKIIPIKIFTTVGSEIMNFLPYSDTDKTYVYSMYSRLKGFIKNLQITTMTQIESDNMKTKPMTQEEIEIEFRDVLYPNS